MNAYAECSPYGVSATIKVEATFDFNRNEDKSYNLGILLWIIETNILNVRINIPKIISFKVWYWAN